MLTPLITFNRVLAEVLGIPEYYMASSFSVVKGELQVKVTFYMDRVSSGCSDISAYFPFSKGESSLLNNDVHTHAHNVRGRLVRNLVMRGLLQMITDHAETAVVPVPLAEK